MFRKISELIYVLKEIILVSLTTTMLSYNMAWAHDFEKGSIEIIHPYINKPFAGAKSAAGYFIIKNHADEEINLLGVSTTLGKAMLHKTTTTVDGVVKMEHQMKLGVPATSELIMKPGGFHIMIMGISRLLAVGEKIPATLRFDGDAEIDIEFVVEDLKKGSNKDKKPKHNH